MNLNIFNTSNLFEAATGLFQQLNIKLNSNTAEPLPAKDILKDHYKPSDTFKAIDKTFFIGIIDDSVFKETGMFDVRYSYKEAIEQGDKNYNGLMLFALELNKQPTRTEISELTRTFNRISQKMPVALLLKYTVANEAVFSIAISERLKYLQNWRQGEKPGKVIILRDIHTQNTHAGHTRILLDLVKPVGVISYEQLHRHWLQVLDVSILNKKFFQDLANWYFWSMDHVSFPDDLEKKKDVRNATSLIRLITRVIFIWFIKEKQLVPADLFRKDHIAGILKDFNKNKKSQNYYNAILQNLFFGTLNQKMDSRKFAKDGDINTNRKEFDVKTLYRYADLFTITEKEAVELFEKVPFLNGGLFDCLDREKDYVDGFSRNTKKKAIVPDFLFFGEEKEVDLNEVYGTKNKHYRSGGLINLLESYKFTVAENTPLEEEIALDPELLGKVFENLLASYNPETQTTARKQTGSFYTPREIVNYMVDESLLEYLKSTVSIPADGKSTGSIPADGNSDTLAAAGLLSNIKDDVGTFFNPNNEIEIHRGNLPHWQQGNVWYFITFRLADSIPAETAEQIKSAREMWHKKNPKDSNGNYSKEQIKEYYRLFSDRIENLLNDCKGSCLLKQPPMALIVKNALLFFNNKRYILDEWVIMPNHVHVLVKPLGAHKLPDILHSWKSFTANEINKVLGKKGQLWTHESYDHIVRNERAFAAIRNYIRQNPVKANLKDGEFLSADFNNSNNSFGEDTVGEAGSSGASVTETTAGSSSATFALTTPESGSSGAGVTETTAGSSSATFALTTPESGSRDASGTLEGKLRSLFSYSEDPNPFNEVETQALIEAINKCKILDPACGSGAFPMGILHKMVHILQKLDPDNKYWKDLQRKKAIEATEAAFTIGNKDERAKRLTEINDVFENNSSDYGRKLYLIENCIYGIDIQPIAVQIAKLRFFISLVIEQKVNESIENFGVRSLPNLETKFVAANTLIGLDKPQQTFLRNPDIEVKENELKELRHKYFTANTRKEKLDLQNQDKKLLLEIAKMLESDGWDTKVAKQIVAFNPYDPNQSAGWFDPEWMFGMTSRFDIIIGNPPWGAKLKDDEKHLFKKTYANIDSSTPNSFAYFIGWAFVNYEYVVSFVLPDSILIKDFSKTRALIKNKIDEIIWYENTGIPEPFRPFIYVDHDVCLINIFKQDKQLLEYTLVKFDKAFGHLQELDYVKPKDLIILEEFEYAFNLIAQDNDLKILKKLSKFDKLANFMQCHEGIHTGNSREILFVKRKINNHCHPLYYGGGAGDRIQNYVSKTSGWLVDYRPEIINKEQGYYASLRDERIFRLPKIYITRTGNPFKAFYDSGTYASNNFFSLQHVDYSKNNEEILKYVLPFIISRLAQYFIRTFAAPRLGSTFIETKVFHLLKLRIPYIASEKSIKIIKMVDEIIKLKEVDINSDTTALEVKLENFIYKLYDLTEEEIKIIEGNQ